MQDKAMEFCELLDKELDKELEKIVNTGTVSPDNIITLKNAYKLKKLMKECDEMEGGGYSSRRGRNQMTGRYMSRSYEDGQSRRNSFGSYDEGTSNRGSYGYSGHGMMEHLEQMYGEAKDERERRMIEEWMRKAEMSQ